MTKRQTYIDIARGIAMICIVLGHLGNTSINRVVFTFHVPIFFLITGYFTTTKLSIKDFIKNKCRTLLVPYLCTCSVIIILGTIKGFLTGGLDNAIYSCFDWIYASFYGAGDSYTHPFYIKGIGAIWFLLATFWGSIFLRVILDFKYNFRVLSVIVLFMFGYFSSTSFWLPFSIQSGGCALLFMYMGFLFKQAEMNIKSFSAEIKIFITICALILWMFFIKNFKSFWLVHCDIGRGVIDIVGCICACHIIILISRKVEKYFSFLSKILSFLGKYSIFVLCIHIIELDLFPWNSFIQNILPFNIPYVANLCILIFCKFIFIIPLTIICAKLKYTRRLFAIK